MKNFITFAVAVLFAVAQPSTARAGSWATIGIGYGALDKHAFLVNLPTTLISAGPGVGAIVTPSAVEGNFDYNTAFAFSADVGSTLGGAGSILGEIVRTGVYFNMLIDDKTNIPLSTINFDGAGSNDANSSLNTAIIVEDTMVINVGGYLGIEFELVTDPLDIYIYADYGIGYRYYKTSFSHVIDGPSGTSSSGTTTIDPVPFTVSGNASMEALAHMVRLGTDAPDLIGGVGLGLEMLWSIPSRKNTPLTLSILAKVSYRF